MLQASRKRTILGLDISTSITGATVLDFDGNLLLCEAWDTRNKKHFPTLYEKALSIKEKLLNIQEDYRVEHIYIEQSLQSFRSGFSSAKTLSTLSRFNGIISYICWELFESEPIMIAATSARKRVGIKIDRSQDSKRQVLKFFLDKNPKVVVEYTHKGNPKPKYKDMADSWVIAMAGINEKTSNIDNNSGEKL